jgi:large subunit ribosomal protein L5
MNPMQNVRLEKLTLNIGVGKEPAKLEKGVSLLRSITGIDPVKTMTMKRIPSWGLRPGLPIGCKITLRRNKAKELLGRLLKARENKLRPSQFDGNGNIAFGIPEYIDIPGVAYDPKIGVMGLQVCVTLEKPGYRVKRRRLMPRPIPRRHTVSRDEAMGFMRQQYGIMVEEQEEAAA